MWGKCWGRQKIAPVVRGPNKTWEGFVGGVLSATAIRNRTWWMTPFTPVVAAAVSPGYYADGIRRRPDHVGHQARSRREDYGTLIKGTAGFSTVWIRCVFAAPVFFISCGIFMCGEVPSLGIFMGCGAPLRTRLTFFADPQRSSAWLI